MVGPNSDWKHWFRVEGGFSRPSNELLFVRDVGKAVREFKTNTEPFSMKGFPDGRSLASSGNARSKGHAV
jgi:hypothetical protein